MIKRLMTLWTSIMEAQGVVIEGVSKNRLIEMARSGALQISPGRVVHAPMAH